MHLQGEIRREDGVALSLATSILLLTAGAVSAGTVDSYNSKPIIAGHSFDSRWQERTRMPGDPEVVLGKDWRRSFWAFSPSFEQQLIASSEDRPPQPAFLSVEELPPGLEAIELRVSWDSEENLYRCSYHLFLSPEVPVPSKVERIGTVSTIPKLPPGIGLKQPIPAEHGMALLDVGAVFSTQQLLSLAPMLQAFRRNSIGDATYVSFHQGTCAALAHSSADKKLEVGVVVDSKQPSPVTTRKVKDRDYAVFAIPSMLITNGSPYFIRASKINDCYLSERRSQETILREPVPYREQRERECKKLRTLPIDLK